MKRKPIIICILVVAVLVCAITAFASPADENIFYQAGRSLKAFLSRTENSEMQNSNETIVAKYNGTPITAASVEHNRKMNILRGEASASEYDTDFNIINKIIESLILLEEAERLGFAATAEEIEATMNNAIETYSYPQGKEMIDSFLEGAGISFDEYMDLVREQVPRNIARQKLIDAIGRQYCEEHGLEFTKINPPAEMVAAQKAYIEQLFEQNKDKIEYFIDIPE
jgi:hypothetical protein